MRRLAVVILLVSVLAACGGDDEVAEEEVEPGVWEELPEAPIEPRLNHTATWAGDRLVVWGGGHEDAVTADGAAWNPEEQSWQEVTQAPIEPRWTHHAFWTGEELIVWGGTAGPDHLAECYVDGARYDPAAGEWRQIPPAPGGARCGASVEWTGDELLVYGGYDAVGPPSPEDVRDDGVAFDPQAGEWREIAPAPVAARHGARSAWTGSQLLVWGGTGADVEPLRDGAAFDPAAGEWRELAASPLTARTGATGVWADGELIVFGGRDADDEDVRDAAAYDPEADSWRELSDVPVAFRSAEAAWTGDVLYVLGAPEEAGAPAFVAYVADEDSWLERPEPPAPERMNHGIAWSGAELFLWGGQAPDRPSPPGAAWQPPS